tara:strand:- start:1157 stop:1576 length:420 start_codon:yes stop_codon:yes gene_type:complete
MVQHCQYHCPKCNKSLTEGKKVQLNFERVEHQHKGLIFLEPEPGNYEFYTSPPTDFKNGERVVFICPKCKKDLTSIKNKQFAELKMMVNDFISFEALFSTVYGDKRTYIVTQDEVDVYGDVDPNEEVYFDIEDYDPEML